MRIVRLRYICYPCIVVGSALLGACAPTATAPTEPASAAASSPEPSPTPPQPPADPPDSAPAPASPPEPIPTVSDLAIDGFCEGRKGLAFADAKPESWDSAAQRRAAAAIQCDGYAIMARVSAVGTTAAAVSALHDRVRNLTRLALLELRAAPISKSRLPLSTTHQRMYEVAAEAERTSGAPEVQVWATNPWQRFEPLQRAVADATSPLSVALMRSERRAIALNVRSTSPTSRTMQIQIQATGVAPSALQIYRVNWTGNDMSSWAAAELQPLGDALAVRQISLLPGITQQLWIQVRPAAAAAAGRFTGSISLSVAGAATTRIPLHMTVFKGRLASRPSLHFGGWDYADGRVDSDYTAGEVDQSELATHLQRRFVDTPWARRHVMPWGRLDANGELVSSPDSAAMQRWLALWTDARRFRIFLNVGNDIAGIAVTDERFPRAVAAWTQFWADEVRRLGKSPEQFDLLLVDEPSTPEQAQSTELWAQAIRQSGAGFGVWSDPLWPDPAATPPSLVDAVDTISINAGFADRTAPAYWDWGRELSRAGKTIELYACEGPARRLDPYAYYRLTMWKAFFAGAAAVSFWSFSDTGGSPSDDEFGAERANYSPLFIGPEIRSGKHLEAAVEGIEDTQYLEMLQRVADTSQTEAVRMRAQQLLNDARAFVLRAPRTSDAQWMQQIESSEADRQRTAIGEFLESLIP
jgi:hypothetical protein